MMEAKNGKSISIHTCILIKLGKKKKKKSKTTLFCNSFSRVSPESKFMWKWLDILLHRLVVVKKKSGKCCGLRATHEITVFL